MGRRGQATLSADLMSRADQMSRKRPASAVTCRDGCKMADDLREWSFGSFTIVPFDGARSPRTVPEGSHCRRVSFGSIRQYALVGCLLCHESAEPGCRTPGAHDALRDGPDGRCQLLGLRCRSILAPWGRVACRASQASEGTGAEGAAYSRGLRSQYSGEVSTTRAAMARSTSSAWTNMAVKVPAATRGQFLG